MKRVSTLGVGLLLLLTPIIAAFGGSIEQQIYRVYIDNQMIGILSDISVYEAYRDKKMAQYLSEYKEDEIIVPANIRIEEEITYIPFKENDEAIIKLIDEKVKFKTDGYYFKVGKSSMCVNQVEEVEAEIEALMTVFVSSDILNELKDESHVIKPLENEGEQVTRAQFKSDVEYISSVCNIDDIVSDEEIGNIILTGEKEPVKVDVLKQDQTIEDVAKENDLSKSEFELLNYRTFNNKLPHIGQIFNVSPITNNVIVEVKKEVMREERISYQTIITEDPNLPEGETYTQQEGISGVKLTSYEQTYVNGKKISEVVNNEREQVITEAQDRIVVKGTKVIPSRGTKDWKWPTTQSLVTCGYLCYGGHYGIDIAGYIGQPIFAADNGVVISAGYNGGYGNSILINHNNGYYTRYAHMSSISVSVGQVVQGGQTIGGLGNTGNSTGPHLHFEIRTDTGSQPSYAPNPMSFY